MGYFSNGTEGWDYEERYCERCVHHSDTGCPVWMLHLMWSSDSCRDEEKANALRMFIPIEEKIYNGECTMFYPKEDE